MSIVQTVFRRHKLRQERHGLKHRNYRSRRSLPAKHAAPDGAWVASGGLGCYKHATPTELVCLGLIPPETPRNRIRQVLPGSPNRAVVPEPTDEANRYNPRQLTAKTLHKALYVGYAESCKPLRVVWLGWFQFPFPEGQHFSRSA
jgi:hypothetical protein